MMSIHLLSRRGFCRLGLGTCGLSLLPRAFAALQPDDERTAWYRDAKFGMFIHWGPYSQASVEASWPVMVPKAGGITEAKYTALPWTFNPRHYDPNAWIDLARTSGQQYMVFTTKHHDGFCMFDSAYTDYKITKTPYGKDIVKQLADACDARDMRLGFYYSPPDMHHPDFRDTSRPISENWHGQPERPVWPMYLQYMQLQLTELLTRYGPACLVWFDGLNDQKKYDGQRVLDLIHHLQPATLVNDRIGVPGDYVTPEQFIPSAIPTRGAHFNAVDQSVNKQLKPGVPRPEDFQLWETCMTINNTWAYNANDHDYKSSRMLIRSLVEVVSRGGNFLLNVGPSPDGIIQPEFEQRLRAIGNWMRVYSDSIYGTQYGPIQGVDALRSTAKRDTVFLHVFDWPARTLTIPTLQRKLQSVSLMANGMPLAFRQSDAAIEIDVPAKAPDDDVSVLAMRLL